MNFPSAAGLDIAVAHYDENQRGKTDDHHSVDHAELQFCPCPILDALPSGDTKAICVTLFI